MFLLCRRLASYEFGIHYALLTQLFFVSIQDQDGFRDNTVKALIEGALISRSKTAPTLGISLPIGITLVVRLLYTQTSHLDRLWSPGMIVFDSSRH
jgi:hypothetical protein